MKACKGLQKSEDLLQFSESAALTFTSNHACRGLQRQEPINENPVPHSKMPVTTGLDYCLLSSRSCVRITQGAFNTPNHKKRSGEQPVTLDFPWPSTLPIKKASVSNW